MPIPIRTNNRRTHTANLFNVDYPYSYPMGLKLKPGSKLHDYLRDRVFERAQESRDAMSSRYGSWEAIDKSLTAYIDLTDEESELKDENENKAVSIVVPVSYATLEVLLTYVVMAFLEDPIFRYEGVGSEDVLGAMLLERVIDVQTRKAKVGIQLHTMFRDAFAYGFGAVAPSWSRQLGYRRIKGDAGISERVRSVRYEGNVLNNIDPYRFFPDVNVAIQDVQRGEYVGWITTENRMNLLNQELADREAYFNGKYLQHIDGRSVLGADESERDTYDVGGHDKSTDLTHPIDVIHMSIELIPSEWKIGRNDYPEKWSFALAGDEVIIKARPSYLDHEMFPVVTCAPTYDGYTVTPISLMETVQGLQTIMNFLYNSHVENIRKAINDMLVVDPSVVNINDVLNPAPGKVIRVRKKAWGAGALDAGVKQLNVTDVTSRHLEESAIIGAMLDMATGSQDVIKGIRRRTSERVSAAEFEGTRGAALSRLEKTAKIASLQAMTDLAYMFASHTQQFMSEDQYVKIAGRYEEELRAAFVDQDRTLVGPLDLLIDYDVSIHDGTLPTSGDPTVWASMFQVIAANPLIAQQFDIQRIFMHWARLAGAKNIGDFMSRGKNINVVGDEKLQKAVQEGNAVPIEEMTNVTG